MTVTATRAHRLQRSLKKWLQVWIKYIFLCYYGLEMCIIKRQLVRSDMSEAFPACISMYGPSNHVLAWLCDYPQLSLSCRSQRSLFPLIPAAYLLLKPLEKQVNLWYLLVQEKAPKTYERPRKSPWRAERLHRSRHLVLKSSWRLRILTYIVYPSKRQIAQPPHKLMLNVSLWHLKWKKICLFSKRGDKLQIAAI